MRAVGAGRDPPLRRARPEIIISWPVFAAVGRNIKNAVWRKKICRKNLISIYFAENFFR